MRITTSCGCGATFDANNDARDNHWADARLRAAFDAWNQNHAACVKPREIPPFPKLEYAPAGDTATAKAA